MLLLFVEISTWLEAHAVGLLGIGVTILIPLFSTLIWLGYKMVLGQKDATSRLEAMEKRQTDHDVRWERHINDKSMHVSQDRFEDLRESVGAVEERVNNRFSELKQEFKEGMARIDKKLDRLLDG